MLELEQAIPEIGLNVIGDVQDDRVFPRQHKPAQYSFHHCKVLVHNHQENDTARPHSKLEVARSDSLYGRVNHANAPWQCR